MDIKASDLRIGNLIHEEVLGNCKVFEILNHVIVVVVNSLEADGSLRKMFYTLNYSCVKPIPLTEELLLRFGCCKINEDIFIYNRFKLIWKKGYKYWYVLDVNGVTYLTKIESVHEFQNFIYVMNGDEVELKNPPVKDQEG